VGADELLDELVEGLDDLARDGVGLDEAGGVGLPDVMRDEARLAADEDAMAPDQVELDGDAMGVEGPEVMAVEMDDDLSVGGFARRNREDSRKGESVAKERLGLGQPGLDLGGGGKAEGDAADLGQLEPAFAGDGRGFARGGGRGGGGLGEPG
jgi:hypothetical protein